VIDWTDYNPFAHIEIRLDSQKPDNLNHAQSVTLTGAIKNPDGDVQGGLCVATFLFVGAGYADFPRR
jgi:hypothetical protein